MPNLMERGATWLASKLQTAGGRSVTYRRANGSAVTLTGTPTRHVYEVLTVEGGAATQVESWDWFITAEDLGFDPSPGDLIRETINGVVATYEVFEIGDRACFEWADTAGILWAVHSRKVE